MKDFQVKIDHVPARYSANTLMETVSKNGKVSSQCSAISFKNIGNVPVMVDQLPLSVGDGMISIGGEPETLDITQYSVVFGEVAPQITTPVKALLVIRRFIVSTKR